MASLLRQLRFEILESRKLLAADVFIGKQSFCDVDVGQEFKIIDESGDKTTVEVQASNLIGLRGAEFRFHFDTSAFDVESHSVKAGAAWRGKASVVAKIDDSAGTLDVFVYSANPITIDSGDLIEFDMKIDTNMVDCIANAMASKVELTKIELNEGEIHPSAHLIVEPFATHRNSPKAKAIESRLPSIDRSTTDYLTPRNRTDHTESNLVPSLVAKRPTLEQTLVPDTSQPGKSAAPTNTSRILSVTRRADARWPSEVEGMSADYQKRAPRHAASESLAVDFQSDLLIRRQRAV